jgi:hypothetical protein
VDKTTLELSPAAILSLAGTTELSGNIRPVFLSDTKAFINRVEEGLIVEWNPSTMEITKVHNVDPLPDIGTELVGYRQHSGYISSEGKMILPVWIAEPRNCCDASNLPQPARAIVAVFDPETGTLEYNFDNRLYGNEGNLWQDPVDGSHYLKPSYRNVFIENYFDTSGLPDLYNVLRINQDGSFDPNFSFDVSEHINFIDVYYYYIYDGNMALGYVDKADYPDYTLPEAYSDRYGLWSAGHSLTFVLIDMETGDITPFNSLDKWLAVSETNTIDGVKYYTATDNQTYAILRQDGPNEFTEVTTRTEGGFMSFGKLW